MSSTVDLINSSPPAPPPNETLAHIKRGSPYYHSGAHTDDNTLKCTLCWKYFCAICNNGTNRLALDCLYCNN